MSRLEQLKARRRVLIERCADERLELAERLAELDPFAMLRGSGDARGAGALRNPLAWAAALAALLFIGRTREVVTFVLWVRSALSVAGRVAQLVRLVTQMRAPRAGRDAPAADSEPVSAR